MDTIRKLIVPPVIASLGWLTSSLCPVGFGTRGLIYQEPRLGKQLSGMYMSGNVDVFEGTISNLILPPIRQSPLHST